MTPHQWGKGDTRRLSVRDVPRGVLALVDARQGGRFCVQCKTLGIETPDSEPLQLDHKQPLSQGGDNHHLNLQWLCRAHNCSKGARDQARAPLPAWARALTPEPRGELVLLRGIPGAGKSTYASRVFPRARILSTDRYFRRPDGSYRFDASRLSEVHEACLRDCRVALNERASPIVVDKCNLTWRAIEPYARLARDEHYAVRVVTLLADPLVCWRRNVHRVPQAKVFELAKILREARLPSWIPQSNVDTNPEAGAAQAANVREHPFRHWPPRSGA